MNQPPTPENIMNLGTAFWGSKTLLSAVELDVFMVLAREPMDASTLRKHLGLHERSALDFFDALVALGMLDRQDGLYSNTPETDFYLDKAKPSYIGGFDLPLTGPIFEEYLASFGLSERFKFIPGDFFSDALPSADVLSMGHILHDWNLGQKQTLIQKAYDALPENGVLLVFESIIDDNRRENAFGLLLSLTMLIETSGGFDYTGADCCGWMKEAGFRETRVEHLAGPESMVIGTK